MGALFPLTNSHNAGTHSVPSSADLRPWRSACAQGCKGWLLSPKRPASQPASKQASERESEERERRESEMWTLASSGLAMAGRWFAACRCGWRNTGPISHSLWWWTPQAGSPDDPRAIFASQAWLFVSVCAQRAGVPHTNPDPIPGLHKVYVREIFVTGAGKAAETMIRQQGESLLCRLETGPGPLQGYRIFGGCDGAFL